MNRSNSTSIVGELLHCASRPAKHRRFFAAAVAMAAAWPAARSWAEVKNPDTFVYAITGDVNSMDPHWEYDGISDLVKWQAYETLIAYKGNSITEFEPLLATIVPATDNSLISGDLRTYTFPIRKGVTFQDGSPMTAEDAKYSLMRFLLMDRAGGSSGLLLQPILGVHSTRDENGKTMPELFETADRAVRVEGGALVVQLKRPYTPFLHILATFAPVISKSWTIARGGWDGTEAAWMKFNNPAKESSYLYDHINGTGPFGLDRWNKNENEVILTRNDRYWRPPARLRTLVFKTVDEIGTRKLLLAAGDADAIFLERQFLPQVREMPEVALEDDLPLLEVHNAFIFNFKINPEANPDIGSGRLDGDGIPADFFADRDVRLGFAHAFDYDAYIRDGYRGKATRARGPIPVQVAGHNPRQPVLEFNPAKAEQAFRKAFNGQVWEKGFQFTISYMEGRADRRLAAVILKRNVEALSPKFKIDIRPVQWSTFLNVLVAEKLPLTNVRWGLDFPDPENCAAPFMHSSGLYAKVMHYSNPRVDQEIEAAAQELDRDKRRRLYWDIQQTAYQDIPAIFTVDTDNLRVYRSWIHRWTYNPMLPYGYFYPVTKGD